MSESVFSQSWHVVSELHVSLLSSIKVHKQYYRGKTWYVLNDSFSSKFFKITPEAYKFLSHLTIKKSVEQIWLEYLEKYPDITPTQDEIVNILTQLHGNNLLYFKNRADSENMFKRATKNRQKEIKSKIASFLFIRVPLWNPRQWLEDKAKFIDVFLSKKFVIVWFAFFIYALFLIAENFDKFSTQGQGILAPSNIVFLYIGLVILKIFHEFGHAMMVRKFGGNVTTMGVMFIVFTPLPYMDASNSWAFKNKYQRALVGAAGMIVELFIAFICVIIWANTGQGAINSIAFNIMIIGSVSSIFFNGNPLLKFDSYYILSDLLEIPNLYQRSREQWFFWIKKYIFGLKDMSKVSDSFSESFWLATYALLSTIYKFIVALLIAVFVADQWFLLGVVVVLISLFIWVLKPIYSAIKYLLNDNELITKRARAIITSSFFVFFVILLFGIIPFDDSIKANGIVQAKNSIKVYSFNDGYLDKVFVEDVQRVKKGDRLILLENRELDFEIEQTKAMILETKAMRLKANQQNIANLKPLNARLELLEEKLDFLDYKKEKLLVESSHNGLFISNDILKTKNRLLKRRELVGEIIDDEYFEFVAVVPQEKVSVLFNDKLFNSQIKLNGIASKTIEVENINIIPHEQYKLPSAALGMLGGGDIAIQEDDTHGVNTKESFFKVIALIKNSNNNPLLYEDRTGVLRIETTKKTLIQQTIRFVRQLLQKRYQL
ncbi:MAG: site-2 protease family protein [Campylobacterota bacterium]